jgi:hypothetical protein
VKRSDVPPELIPFCDALAALLVADYLRRKACDDARKAADPCGTRTEAPKRAYARRKRRGMAISGAKR